MYVYIDSKAEYLSRLLAVKILIALTDTYTSITHNKHSFSLYLIV